jgi:hypothetical protein
LITDWDKLINRMKQEIDTQLRNNNSAKEQGMVKLDITILAGCNGPILWMVDSKRIEPGTRAKELLLD